MPNDERDDMDVCYFCGQEVCGFCGGCSNPKCENFSCKDKE